MEQQHICGFTEYFKPTVEQATLEMTLHISIDLDYYVSSIVFPAGPVFCLSSCFLSYFSTLGFYFFKYIYVSPFQWDFEGRRDR